MSACPVPRVILPILTVEPSAVSTDPLRKYLYCAAVRGAMTHLLLKLAWHTFQAARCPITLPSAVTVMGVGAWNCGSVNQERGGATGAAAAVWASSWPSSR